MFWNYALAGTVIMVVGGAGGLLEYIKRKHQHAQLLAAQLGKTQPSEGKQTVIVGLVALAGILLAIALVTIIPPIHLESLL